MKSFTLIVLGFLLSLCPTRAAATESPSDSLSSPASRWKIETRMLEHLVVVS